MDEKYSRALWCDLLEFPLDGRLHKPRFQGLTMVIDKGLGLHEMQDILHVAGKYIDFWKLGFGTSALYSQGVLEEKISLARAHNIDIYPGGTFLEIAIVQNRLEEFLHMARYTGFSAVEISDGSVAIKRQARTRAISLASRLGFKVLTEVGKKDPGKRLNTGQLIETVRHDLENGACQVIMEGRESGRDAGCYDADGYFAGQIVEELENSLGDTGRIIWEAPLKHQQRDLILRFGPNVNMGNIAPQEILATEALRVGLREDTLKTVYWGEY